MRRQAVGREQGSYILSSFTWTALLRFWQRPEVDLGSEKSELMSRGWQIQPAGWVPKPPEPQLPDSLYVI